MVVTVAINRGFLLRLNRRTMVDLEVPFTRGKWERTGPVIIDLKKGRNSLQFTLKAPNKGLTIWATPDVRFSLYPVRSKWRSQRLSEDCLGSAAMVNWAQKETPTTRAGAEEERATGIEPATSSLGSWHSTAELRPQGFEVGK